MTQEKGIPYQRHKPSAALREFLDPLDPGSYFDCGQARLRGLDDALLEEAESRGRRVGDDSFQLVATDMGLIYCRPSISFAIAARWNDVTLIRPHGDDPVVLQIAWPTHGDLKFTLSKRLAGNIFRRWLQLRMQAERLARREKAERFGRLENGVRRSGEWEVVDEVAPPLATDPDGKPIGPQPDRRRTGPPLPPRSPRPRHRSSNRGPDHRIAVEPGPVRETSPRARTAVAEIRLDEVKVGEVKVGEVKVGEVKVSEAKVSDVVARRPDESPVVNPLGSAMAEVAATVVAEAEGTGEVGQRVEGTTEPPVDMAEVAEVVEVADEASTDVDAWPSASPSPAPSPSDADPAELVIDLDVLVEDDPVDEIADETVDEPVDEPAADSADDSAEPAGDPEPLRTVSPPVTVAPSWIGSPASLVGAMAVISTFVVITTMVVASYRGAIGIGDAGDPAGPALDAASVRTTVDHRRFRSTDSIGSATVQTVPPVATASPTGFSSTTAEITVEGPRLCNSNYTGCVPQASDVDCPNDGDGPVYAVEQATVMGEDIYGLDTDGDGQICEPDQPRQQPVQPDGEP